MKCNNSNGKLRKYAPILAAIASAWAANRSIGAAINWGSAFEIQTQADIQLTDQQVVYAMNGGDNNGNSIYWPTDYTPATTENVTINSAIVPFEGFGVTYGAAAQFANNSFGDVNDHLHGVSSANVTILGDSERGTTYPQSFWDYRQTPAINAPRTYNANTGNAGLDSILASQVFSDARHSQTTSSALEVWLNNLTPGIQYQLQLVGPADGRPSDSGKTDKSANIDQVVDDNGNIATNLAADADLNGDGTPHVTSVIGTFTADSSSFEHITIENQNGGRNPGFSALVLTTAAPQWAMNISGDWNSGSNWTTLSAPNAPGAEADFSGQIQSAQTVTLNAAQTVGILNFNNVNSYTIAGSGNLTVEASPTSFVPAQLVVQKGAHAINVPTTIASNATLSVASSASLTVGSSLTINPSVSLTDNAGTATFGSIAGGGQLNIADSGAGNAPTVTLAPGGGQSVVGSLTVTGNGALDITNNTLIINYGSGTDPIASIAALIDTGYAGGAWTGTGITSSTARANAGSFGVGYADSADPGNPAGLASGQIEVRYTLLGDANLDGKVNGTDFAILATNFNQSVSGWDAGDFNYDGKANGTDFAYLASNFNQGIGGAVSSGNLAALEAFAAANGLLTSVPEPGSTALLAFGGLACLRRRRS